MIKLTLQNRVTTLLVISSLLFISAFTFIQLNNQIDNINRYNSYQANLSSIIVKNSLENILRQTTHASLEPSGYLQSSLLQLKEAGVVKDALIFNKEGKILACAESSLIGKTVRYKEIGRFSDLEYLAAEGKWFIAKIDKAKKRLDMYLAIKTETNTPVAYVAKISFSLGNIQEALLLVYKPVILTTIIIILLNIFLGFLISKTVIGPIKILNEVTKIIAAGNLTVRTDIHTHDELQELGETFNYMTTELIKMKERAENANPLTKLPGNIVIREEVEKRIKENRQFVVIYCDLDNFKAFNDKYGIAKGDEVIKLTADIFKEAVKAMGNPDDFVGHEGGDDFILLTTPDKVEGITDYIIKEFDKHVRNLYNPEDLSQGYIISTARDGTIKKFPIMTISLAGVTNAHRTITSYTQVTNIAAEVKKKAKSIEGSVFVLDKRKD
ncbi:MAG: diguanylate cyclase [Candidatus Omnitrophica bacterium]|nr:diguanylate cyclase [Candidatus Omnitrophota bacterium]